MTEPAIEIEGLSFAYSSDIPVLTDVRLSVWPLDSACIVGPNGGGKTTLIKLLLGLLTPNSGSIRVFGQAPAESRTRIGYVPQHARYDACFPISALEVVCMARLGRSLSGRYTKQDKQTALDALASVQLADLARRPFAALSGGQRQRVLIARALASGGDILILDEPTASLDRESEQQLLALLAELNQQLIVLMVTHEVGFSSTFFKRIICVNNKVYVHPTSALTGELIQEMYGGDLRMIRHDHRCCPEGHEHD
jgi:zinc transport system ATP-binding protein